MKFVHLSDLHIGKKVNEFSMLEDQEYILTKIFNIIIVEQPQAVFIAGDIYDKSVPPTEAVQLFDDFLYKLAQAKLEVFIISGNHDSAERISFGSHIMDESGIHFSPVYKGKVTPITVTDNLGEVNIFMLPFLKPANVRRFFPDEEINSYTEAMATAINQMNVNKKERNIIITHQFVTGALRSDSEDISVGGTDNVDKSVFKDFDYTALGHIHSPQNVGSYAVRYCGTPLKYSFSEAGHKKSVTIGELSKKGNLNIKTIPLIPKHDMRELKGKYMDLTNKDNYQNTALDDYIHITLTDEEDVPDAIGKLRVIYPNLMKLDYDNKRTRNNFQIKADENIEIKSPLELLAQFYKTQNNSEMDNKQRDFANNLINKIWEAEL